LSRLSRGRHRRPRRAGKAHRACCSMDASADDVEEPGLPEQLSSARSRCPCPGKNQKARSCLPPPSSVTGSAVPCFQRSRACRIAVTRS
jgi:hypothetical protein